jgi:hypothetical protein
MEDQTQKLLKEISETLKAINDRQDTNEMFAKSDKRLDKVDQRIEYSTQQIQNTFDRIHDKVFNFNNILIGAFLVLGTFPSESPILYLWTVIFPIVNLVFMILLEIRQMNIHRFAANEEKWIESDYTKHGKMIDQQTLLSLLSFILSLSSLIYLVVEVWNN